MRLSRVRGLIVLAAILDGILAGAGLDRALVTFPAWRVLGPLEWAAFSRHADLGAGRFWYPLWAVIGMICSIIAAAILYRDSSAPRAAKIPVYAAALFTIGGLLFTLKAAPIMLGLKRLDDDPVMLQ
jgi:hypothetical protein